MFTVTDRRREQAQHIMDEYAQRLQDHGGFDAGSLEHELRRLWDTSYQEIKSAMIQYFSEDGDYGRVAHHYMLSHSPMIPSEFKRAIATANRPASH